MKQLLGRLVRRQCLHALPNPITVHDVIMYWHPQISNDALELGLRDYERDTRILCQKLLHSGMTMVDVGAHIGYYSLLAAKLVGEEGKVYAFEPDPLNYSLLKKNIEANGRVSTIVAVNKAASNQRGSMPLFSSGGGSSLYQTRVSGKQSVMVETVTLDEFFENCGWPRVDVIKMDIEGAEKLALQGAKTTIEKNPELKLIVEFSPGILADVTVTSEEFLNVLRFVGFKRVYAIKRDLVPVANDEPLLNRMAKESVDGYVNLFCEK